MKSSISLKSVRHSSVGCFKGLKFKRHPTRKISDHELIIVLKGKLNMFEEKQKFEIQKHQFLLLSPNREHGGLDDYEPNLSFYWFHFDLPKGIGPLPKFGHFKRGEIVFDLASRLLDEQERNDAPHGSCDALIYLLLLECSLLQDNSLRDPSGIVDNAILFVNRNFSHPISTRDVAEYCHCHPDHLGRVFQARMHVSISHFIRERRIRHARSLLRDTNLNIEIVANQSGFGEAHYFRRCFKDATGNTPTMWRAMHCRMFKN